MSLRRYMLLSTVINLTLFSSLALVGILLKKLPPNWAFAILCPLVVLMFQYWTVWPKAKALPLQARESFWSYRSANAGTWMMIAVLLISTLAALIGW